MILSRCGFLVRLQGCQLYTTVVVIIEATRGGCGACTKIWIIFLFLYIFYARMCVYTTTVTTLFGHFRLNFAALQKRIYSLSAHLLQGRFVQITVKVLLRRRGEIILIRLLKCYSSSSVCVYICLRDASLGKNCPVFIKGGAKI